MKNWIVTHYRQNTDNLHSLAFIAGLLGLFVGGVAIYTHKNPNIND